ncbi:MAG: TolC family protein [Gammaproteobacteria bacterium]|nr:TolC family protein [Gammaproteobacteria bacterium]
MSIFLEMFRGLFLTGILSLVFFMVPITIHGQDSPESGLLKPEMLMDTSSSKDFFKSLQMSVIEHPVFLSSEANLLQSKEVLNIAKAPRKPQVSLFGSTTNRLQSSYDDRFSFFENSPIKDRTSAGILVEQLLFDFFSTKYQINEARNNLLADEVVQEQKVNSLLLKMVTSCLDTASYEILKALVQDSVRRHKEITEKIRIRVESGRAPTRELSRANARLAEAEAKLLRIELNYDSSKAEFMQLMPNIKACSQMIGIDKSDLILDQNQAIEMAINTNLNIKEIDLRIRAAEENVLKQRSNFWPRLNLTLQGDLYNPEYYMTKKLEEHDIYLGIQFESELYTGGRKNSQLRIAKEQLNQLSYDRSTLAKDITSNIESLLSQLKNSGNRIDAYESAFDANGKSRDNLNMQFQTSNVSLLELLQAERDLLESAENMVFNQRSVILSGYTQKAILGQLKSYVEASSN